MTCSRCQQHLVRGGLPLKLDAERILAAAPQTTDRLTNVGIDKYVRAWEKPSDHVPVWIDLDIEAK